MKKYYDQYILIKHSPEHKGVGTCLILGGPNYKIYKLSKMNALNYGSYTFFTDVQEQSKIFKSEAGALP